MHGPMNVKHTGVSSVQSWGSKGRSAAQAQKLSQVNR
jgi:hypothetical protein